MSKERLEEINNFSSLPLKKRISLTKESIKKELKANDYHMPKNININTQYLLEIIEQAERVQELKNVNRVLKKANEGSERDKERLREQIDEIEIENETLSSALHDARHEIRVLKNKIATFNQIYDEQLRIDADES